MHIEFIGCTSAGKTTLARKIVDLGKQEGIDVILGDDLVLHQLHLDWIKHEFVRRRLLEICSAYVCLRHWREYHAFILLVIKMVFQAPGSWFYKANLARNVLRKVGIHQIIRHSGAADTLILVDNDGIVQGAHQLFVHSNGKLNGELSGFADLAPLPDVIAYVRQPEVTLLQRTLKRGHPRLPARSRDIVQHFVREASKTFDRLQKVPQIADRLLVIDGENKTVVKLSPTNEPLVDRACDLMQVSLKNGRSEAETETPGSPGQVTPGLELIDRLAGLLRSEGIKYCHWKSNIKLEKSLEGEEDLDFFVGRDSESRFLSVLTQLGFKAASIKYGPETAGVTHYYGFDVKTGKLVHVHLFTRLVTGESFVKSHRFPFEKLLLENCERIGQMQVLSKSAELVLFVLRTFIKYGSPLDMMRLGGKASEIRNELRWLLDGGDISKSLSLVRTHCPEVDEPLFLTCIDAINRKHSFVRKVFLALQIRSRLRRYKENSFLKHTAKYASVLRAKLQRVVRGIAKNKTLHSGGTMIAFVGADATGKSTLVKETRRWLGSTFIVRIIHTGKPPSSWLTAPVNLARSLFRGLGASQRIDRLKSATSSNDPTPSKHTFKGLSSLVYALRAVTLAWDRERLVHKARRLAADGQIIICDRYPSLTIGAMDSPRLEETSVKTGAVATIYNRLARLEKELYQKIPSPDMVLKLRVSLETAKKRNCERDGQDGDAYLESRHRQSAEWYMPGTNFLFDIDTEQSLEETISKVKQDIWAALK